MSEKIPQLYAVGGTPRAGKGTVTAAFRKQYPETAHISGDEVRAKLWKQLRPRQQFPELFQQHIDHELYPTERDWLEHVLLREGSPDYFIDRHYKQNEAVQRLGLEDQIHQTIAGSHAGRLIVEGVAVMPAFVKKLEQENQYAIQAVFLGNENPGHVTEILETVHQAKSLEDSWLFGKSDEWVVAYMGVNRLISARTRKMAAEYDFPYFDMGDGDFQQNVQCIVGYLATGEMS